MSDRIGRMPGDRRSGDFALLATPFTEHPLVMQRIERTVMMNPLIRRLKLIHARLDAEIRCEASARFFDSGRIKRLKKLKLAVKDQLHRTAPRAARAG
jgi:hypothetical protein